MKSAAPSNPPPPASDAIKSRTAFAPKIDTASAEKPVRPASVIKRPNVPVTPQSQTPPFAVAAAALLAAVIGGGAYWFFSYEAPVSAREEQPVNPEASYVAVEVAAVEERVLENENRTAAPSATQDGNVAAAAALKASAPTSPKQAMPPRSTARVELAAAKPARALSTTRDAVPAVASVSASAPRGREAAAPATRSTGPAPVGPFFEPKDVTESPRVAARVDPKLPNDLKARAVGEIVIVRALVSQTGHPSRISLLRRSKTGPQVDDVVVEAVNQWKFSPAKRKGEPVSCWFNFGVQVGDAN